MYKVIRYFTDLHDENYPYCVGDTYPRIGIEVTEDRVRELSGCDNKQHMPLIEEVEDKMAEAIRDAAEKKGKQDD